MPWGLGKEKVLWGESDVDRVGESLWFQRGKGMCPGGKGGVRQ